MSSNINIVSLIGGVILIMLPIFSYAQEASLDPDREKALSEDVKAYAERALKDGIIDREKKASLLAFITDSLPEQQQLRIKALESILNGLDAEYDKAMKISSLSFDERAYMAEQMVPSKLYIPQDYVSEQEKGLRREIAAAAKVRELTNRYLKRNAPLAMPPALRAVLRLLFGLGTNPNPARWDLIPVDQMGRVYTIIMPGGQPQTFDESLFNDTEHYDPAVYKRTVPQMVYDPHPDKHFRR